MCVWNLICYYLNYRKALTNVRKSLRTQFGVWTKVHRSNEDFQNLYSNPMIVCTATTAASTTIILLLTTNIFPLQCLIVLRFEVLTVVLLKVQVSWDVFPYCTVTMSQTIWIFSLIAEWLFENLLTYNERLTSCTMFTRVTHCSMLSCIIPSNIHLLLHFM